MRGRKHQHLYCSITFHSASHAIFKDSTQHLLLDPLGLFASECTLKDVEVNAAGGVVTSA